MLQNRTTLLFLAIATLLLAPTLFAQTCERIYLAQDRFEVGFGDRLTEFRINSLELDHPHTIFDNQSLGLCHDATNDPIMLFNVQVFAGVNPELQAHIDALELNILTQLNPFGQEDGFASCLVGLEAECETPSRCSAEADGLFLQAATQIQRTDACVDAIDGLFDGTWPDGETTQPNLPEAGSFGCHVSTPVDAIVTISLDDSDLGLSLRDLVVAGRFDDEPPEALLDGVMYGFLTEEDADDIIITVESDFGPFTFNLGEDILPSDGPGVSACEPRTHCDGPDARVTHNGQCGWWFVFNFTAERIR